MAVAAEAAALLSEPVLACMRAQNGAVLKPPAKE